MSITSKLLETIYKPTSYTENGAATYSSSLDTCLDYFSVGGTPLDYSSMFWDAFKEDPNIALKILFWSRDVRGGSGARKTFSIVMKEMQDKHPDVFSKIYKYIPEFGYWKDIFSLKPTSELVQFVVSTLLSDHDHSLCAKYCPRKGWWFSEIRNELDIDPKGLRKMLVSKTNVVESEMCAGTWDFIDYSKVPSIASLRYRRAFRTHDPERYTAYIDSVNKGQAKINSSTLYPHDIYKKYCDDTWQCSITGTTPDTESIKALWDNLPDLMKDCKDRVLPVCDVSGSMTGTPMDVSVALGCYISERNIGPFRNAFITFSESPTLQYLTGDIIERFNQLQRADWGGNTDLQAVFDLILSNAVKNHVSETEMPNKILIISDMQLDSATKFCWRKYQPTNFQEIKRKYEEAGYALPEIVFWNVNGRAGNVPVTMSELNVGLVSGYSPNILKSILAGKIVNPYQLMLDVICTDRYKDIHI